MIPARGPQTKFLYHLCRTILGAPYTYVPLERRLASWGAGDMARAWHTDEWLARGDAWYFLHERLTQRVKNPIQNVGLRQCATTTISTHAPAIYTNAL